MSVVQEGPDVAALYWGAHAPADHTSKLLQEARKQIDAYFAGRLRRFDLPMSCRSAPSR